MNEKSVLAASLPTHWGLVQRAKNDLIYLAVRTALAVVRRLPFGLSRMLAVGVGHVAACVDRKDRGRAERQLMRAMPELAATDARRIARQMFVHLAICAVEVIHARRFVEGEHAVVLPAEARGLLDAALAEGRGVVIVSGHIGNWELCGQVFARAGYPVTSIAKPVYDPRLTRLVNEARTAFGQRILWRGDANVAKEILRIFKENGILGILIDQDTRVQGVFVPFFGILSHTPTAAASFALRANAAVLLLWGHRVGHRHEIHVERCTYTASGDHDADVHALTATLSTRLEAGIREHPEQWVWLHERWKKQPAGVDSATDALNNQAPAASSAQRSLAP